MATDYFLQARVEIRTPEELTMFLNFQNSVQSVLLKNGSFRRLRYQNSTVEIFSLDTRANNPADVRKVYDGLVLLMENNDIPGAAAWHECRHEDLNVPCSWNAQYNNPPLPPGGAM